MPTQLHVTAGPAKGQAFPLAVGTSLTIGRSATSQTKLVDPHVSRAHCEIRWEAGQALLVDCKSAAGTFVNGQRVENHKLKPGDVIRIGDTQLRFDIDVSADQTLPPPDAVKPEIVFAGKTGRKTLPKPLQQLHDLVGTKLGSYQLLSVVGTGLVGAVFRAGHVRDQKIVALKVLRSDFSRDDKAVQRFLRGMKIACSLDHPHIVGLFNAGIAKPYCWVAMEFVEGESLAQIVGGPGRKLEWHSARHVAIQLAKALAYIHERGVIHRNVMPQNILIRTSDKCAKLGDVMLAKSLEGDESQQVTGTDEMVGNVYYMSPECTMGSADIDGRADIYSLGVTIYQMVTGQLPFSGNSLIDVVMKIRNAVPESPSKLKPTLPPAFAATILKMLAKRPEDRFQTAAELLIELEAKQ